MDESGYNRRDGIGRRQPDRRRRQRAAAIVLAVCLVVVASAAALAWSRYSRGQATGPTGVSSDSDPATVADSVTVKDITRVSGPGPGLQPQDVPEAVPASGGLTGAVICIDPGHAATTDSGTEPIGPGSSQLKVKDPGGTSGVVTGVREPVVTLAISLYLKDMLEAEGATVVMTRSGVDFSGGNRERAQIANQAGADLFIRIHADGSSDPSRHGVSTLYPASIPGWTDDIHESSWTAAAAVQAAMANNLAAPDLGTVERSDISGFNWADVPVILVEVGFMSNPDEDIRLTGAGYQQQVAAALTAGIRAFLYR